MVGFFGGWWLVGGVGYLVAQGSTHVSNPPPPIADVCTRAPILSELKSMQVLLGKMIFTGYIVFDSVKVFTR